jgi:hypothetical protein
MSRHVLNFELHREISRIKNGKKHSPEKYLVVTRRPRIQKSTRFESDKLRFHLKIRVSCFYSEIGAPPTVPSAVIWVLTEFADF